MRLDGSAAACLRFAGEVEQQRAGGVLGLLDRDQQALGLEVEVLLERAARDFGAGLMGRPFGEFGAVPHRWVGVVDVDLGAEDVLVADLRQAWSSMCCTEPDPDRHGRASWRVPVRRRGATGCRCGGGDQGDRGGGARAAVRCRRPCPAGWSRTGPPSRRSGRRGRCRGHSGLVPSVASRLSVSPSRSVSATAGLVPICISYGSVSPSSVGVQDAGPHVLRVLAQAGHPRDTGDRSGVGAGCDLDGVGDPVLVGVGGRAGRCGSACPRSRRSARRRRCPRRGVGAGQLLEIVGEPVGIGIRRSHRCAIVDAGVAVTGRWWGRPHRRCRARRIGVDSAGSSGSTVVRVGISRRIGRRRGVRVRSPTATIRARLMPSQNAHRNGHVRSDRQDATAK